MTGIFARLALYLGTRMFGSHFNSQNTNSHFHNSHFTLAPQAHTLNGNVLHYHTKSIAPRKVKALLVLQSASAAGLPKP